MLISNLPDSKVNKLLEIINLALQNGTKKIIIFALFIKTIKYLKIRLEKAGFQSLILHGKIDNRAEVLYDFQTNDNVNILISSEVGSEGLDMQFCNTMVNYDLPWNPMVVEQRIGRIDRFGQQSKIINIYNFIITDSIQEIIYTRLLERINIFRNTIGDIETILESQVKINDQQISINDLCHKLEQELYTTQLTQAQIEHRIAEVEQALANEQENLRHIQEDLDNTMTNDAYFNEEINRILTKRAYVTPTELENYLQVIIRKCLPTCTLKLIKENVWQFTNSDVQPKAFWNFLLRHIGSSEENQISLNQFRQKIENNNKLLITFNQDIAYNNPQIHFFNIYHPVIQACLNYFIQNEDENITSFCYAINTDEILSKGKKYYMGLYQLTSKRNVHNIEKRMHEIIPVIFDIENNRLEEDTNIINHIYSISQTEGIEYNARNEDIVPTTIENMRLYFTEYINHLICMKTDEENRKNESDRIRNEQQTIEYFAPRIKNFEVSISEQETILDSSTDEKEKLTARRRLQLAKVQMDKLITERDNKLSIINKDPHISIEEKLLIINLIYII